VTSSDEKIEMLLFVVIEGSGGCAPRKLVWVTFHTLLQVRANSSRHHTTTAHAFAWRSVPQASGSATILGHGLAEQFLCLLVAQRAVNRI
jgi:hypothetical protein